MRFLHPEFLYALLALAIPIIIHLFNFRRFKRVVFPNTRFLKEVELQTRSRSRLKHLLVLLSRLLAIAALVFAFAQPFLPSENADVVAGRKAISIYVDNSFSMEQENEAGELLQQAKDMASDIVRTYAQNDRYQILTNDFEGRHQRLISQEECLELIDEIDISSAVRRLSEVQQRMTDVLSKEDVAARRAFYLSDMQKTTADMATLRTDTTISSNIIAIEGNEVGNVYIDSIWFKSPVRQLNGDEELSVRVINGSGKDLQNIPIKVMVNGQQKAIGNVSLHPYSTADSVLYFSNNTAGIMEGVVEIDDHPITFDDSYFFAYRVAESTDILLISSANSNRVEALYKDDDLFSLSTSRPGAVDYSTFARQDLIVVDGLQQISSGMIQELMKFVENGGSVVVLPAINADKASYNELLLALGANTFTELETEEVKVSDIDTQHPLFDGVFDRIPRNVDLPQVQKYLRFLKRSQSREERLMSLQNGASFASVYPKGTGRTYVFSVGTDRSMSNFTRHSFFVTTLLRIAEMSQGRERIAYTVGEDDLITLRYTAELSDEPFHLKQRDGQVDIIPERRTNAGITELFLHGQVKEAGIYRTTFAEDHLASVGFNFAREESQMDFLNKEGVDEALDNFGLTSFQTIATGPDGFSENVDRLSEGRKLWKWCIILALIFLAIEVLLLKFWKT